MKLTAYHSKLLAIGQDVFDTSDAAVCLGIRAGHANKILTRLSETGHIIRIKRGRWIVPDRLTPLELAPHLTAPFPGYVSLQSALYYHGVINQIPSVIYVVSLSRSVRLQTPLGCFSVHHIHPSFFFGYETLNAGRVKMACLEKAVLDLLYLGSVRSGLFRAWPEVSLPRGFRVREARRMIRLIPSVGLRNRINARFTEFMEAASS